ncbi:WD40/YVTN/BNR-like repeat-containing protein [Derxia lacustris]|uniref:WD40/YVTN/BNR-like repeat-containing protein n=1 Tax=Derxia lacustris TaxID=764842 RepID=UPI000A175EA9|nr:YCF48-related protein [Derxia lacustris]
MRPQTLARRAAPLLRGLALALSALLAPAGAGAADTPAALTEPALASARAAGAATLAVTRAGNRLVAAGERGIVLLSDNDGASWRQARVPVRTSLTALRFVDARHGWATGHLGSLLRSEDGGESWTLQLDGVRAAELVAGALAGGDERAQRSARSLLDEGPDKPFFDLDFNADGHGFAVGAYNLAVMSTDGGASWQPLSPRLPNPRNLHLYAVRSLGRQVFIAGEQGLLLRSDDGGASFVALASPYKGSFFALLTTRAGSLLACGLRGNVFRSDDLGASWQKVETGLAVSIGAGIERDDGSLLLLSQAGDLLASHDDGRSFRRLPEGAAVPAAGLAATADGRLSIASLRGMRRLAAP